MEQEPKSLTVSCNKKAIALRYAVVLIPVAVIIPLLSYLVFKTLAGIFFVGIITLICCTVIFFSFLGNAGTLTFCERDEYRGARVHIEGKNRSWEVADILGSDCIFKQSKSQLKADRGDLRFRDHSLSCMEVENVSAIREFIDQYFPKMR